ncbi:esterase/lipase family protein [Streptomyces sp. NPDC055109]
MSRINRKIFPIISAAFCLATLIGAPAQAATRDPVLFVHGWSGGAWNWSLMKSDFLAAGYDPEQIMVMSYDTYQSNIETAYEVRDAIRQLRARTGARKVDIVTHSMGALSSRYYLKFLGGTDYVDDWLSIGGPNHGTSTAALCSWALDSCREMRRGSSFLSSLNAGDETPGSINYSTLWSDCDEIVNPDESAILAGANNIYVGCYEHASLLASSYISYLAQELTY